MIYSKLGLNHGRVSPKTPCPQLSGYLGQYLGCGHIWELLIKEILAPGLLLYLGLVHKPKEKINILKLLHLWPNPAAGSHWVHWDKLVMARVSD